MPGKPKGTSIRKAPDGQLEFTMLPKKSGRKGGWQFTSQGKMLRGARQNAIAILKQHKGHVSVMGNEKLLLLCEKFVHNFGACTSADATEIFNAMNQIKSKPKQGKPLRKGKDVSGQQTFGFQ